MKEITLRLVDEIADFITNDAKEMGLTSEELVKFIVGMYVQHEKHKKRSSAMGMMIGIDAGQLMEEVKGDMGRSAKEFLKRKAAAGDLKCKNCTMALTEQDIDNKKCGTCDAPLTEALGGRSTMNNDEKKAILDVIGDELWKNRQMLDWHGRPTEDATQCTQSILSIESPKWAEIRHRIMSDDYGEKTLVAGYLAYKEFYNEDRGLPEPRWGPRAIILSSVYPLQCPTCNSQDMFHSACPDDPEELFLHETVRCGHCGHITDWFEAVKQRENHPTDKVMEVTR